MGKRGCRSALAGNDGAIRIRPAISNDCDVKRSAQRKGMEEVISWSCGKMQTYLSGFRAVQCLMIDCHGEVSKKWSKCSRPSARFAMVLAVNRYRTLFGIMMDDDDSCRGIPCGNSACSWRNCCWQAPWGLEYHLAAPPSASPPSILAPPTWGAWLFCMGFHAVQGRSPCQGSESC